jgi:hypothetical protein
MSRKIHFIISFLTVVVAYAQSSEVSAEVVCTSEVSYRWVGEDRVESKDPAEPKQSDSNFKEEEKKVKPQERLVRFASIERRGKDEQSARIGLIVEVNRQKARAHERCKREHESFGDCVSTKMSIKGSTLNSLSFSARSKVEEALIDECRVQQGRCTSIDSNEPTCRDLAVSSAGGDGTPAPGGEKDAAKSDAGGEKAEGDKKAPEAAADKGKAPKKKP